MKYWVLKYMVFCVCLNQTYFRYEGVYHWVPDTIYMGTYTQEFSKQGDMIKFIKDAPEKRSYFFQFVKMDTINKPLKSILK